MSTSGPTEPTASSRPWWRTAVFYEIYVRSFADGDGDGIGDLLGVRQRLPYLAELGVDALWLTPFYLSPMADGGYDVADPRAVDPMFGQLADLDALLVDAHELGLRVTVDLVPNHTSDRHPWFTEALYARPGSAARERYLFRPGRGAGGQHPPNNWLSVFGGPAWERELRTGEWYLHSFAREQPDLNWRNPEVAVDYERTLRFWLDRGVDGFRIDVAHGLVKDAELRDNPGSYDPTLFGHGEEERHAWNQPEVHDVYRSWRRLLDGYPGDRVATGEVWVRDPVELARYVRPDELHLAFNFHFLDVPWDAARLRNAVAAELARLSAVGAPATWVLSNHDLPRHRSRFASLARARAASLLLLGLPGVAYLYNGEELGLPQADVPEWAIQDPQWHRSGGKQVSRDGARVPLPWSGSAPPYGFCPADVSSWLPQPADWASLTVAAQAADPTSTLSLYRAALRLRRGEAALGAGRLRWRDAPPGVLAFDRLPDEGDRPDEVVTVMVNVAGNDTPIPEGEVLLTSGPIGGTLPRDTAVWLRSCS